LAQKRRAEGFELLAWTSEAAAPLEAAGLRPLTPQGVLPEDAAAHVDDAAISWTRAFGNRRLWDGRSLRELSSWKGLSLWWFAELYLFHSTRATGHVRAIETFLEILRATDPGEAEAVGLSADETVLLERACLARGVLFHGGARRARLSSWLGERKVLLRARWVGVKTRFTAAKSWLRGPVRLPPAERRRVVFLSHAAFWKTRTLPDGSSQAYEHYFGRLIPGVAEEKELAPYVVVVGPFTSFKRRGVGARLREWLGLGRRRGPFVHMNRFTTPRVVASQRRALGEALSLWRRLRRSAGAHEAFSHAGVRFADLCETDLAALLLLQLPWAVRSYEEVAALLESAKPALLCLYAEDSGWGRAAEAACRAASVPTLAVQHGVLYPRYFSYQHGADEAECPRPDRTAVFGEAARRYLIAEGHYRPESLVVTGSPKFDDLLETSRRWDREALRRELGVAAEQRLVVVASRHRGIRPTHRAIGSVFPALVAAAEALEGVWLVVKPHPAEAAEPYLARVRQAGSRRCRVVSPSTDLLPLLYAADALVTVESLSAVEALVLGRPILILNMPTNQREMVERGAALGVPAGADPGPALSRLLFDAATREALAAARARYLPEVAFGLDGGATERVLSLIRETAC